LGNDRISSTANGSKDETILFIILRSFFQNLISLTFDLMTFMKTKSNYLMTKDHVYLHADCRRVHFLDAHPLSMLYHYENYCFETIQFSLISTTAFAILPRNTSHFSFVPGCYFSNRMIVKRQMKIFLFECHLSNSHKIKLILRAP
jgi:hypothetical protein